MKLRTYAVLVSLAVIGLIYSLIDQRRINRDLAERISLLGNDNANLRFAAKQAARQASEVGQRAVELDSQLGSAKTRVTVTESKQVQLARELHETKAQLTEREQREVGLMTELATLREKSNAVEAAPSAGTGRPSSIDQRIADLERQLARAGAEASAEPPATDAASSPAISRQVVRVGPRNSFVVLDFGLEQGAHVGDKLIIRRGTNELARVEISGTRPRFSLAQVLPGTLKGQLQTGDLAVLNP